MDMMSSEFVWVITIATFLAIALIPILGLYVIEAVRLNWRSGQTVHRIEDRRRSKRFDVSLPVFVYGHQSDTEPFAEEATVSQVSTHGGLLKLAMSVQVGQQLPVGLLGSPEMP